MSGILNVLAAIKGAAAAVTDAYYNLVTLLLNTNTTNGAQNNTFLDSGTANSGSGFTITRNGNTTQGTFTPFSQTGWSNYFNGSSYFTVADIAALQLGTGNFTIEGWIYLSTLATAQPIFDQRASGGSTYAGVFYIDTAGKPNAYFQGTPPPSTNPSIVFNVVLSTNTWYHIAWVRNGNTLSCYVNGVAASNTLDITAYNNVSSANRIMNAFDPTYSTGYLSNFRITKGGALYTSTFTPSTTPLTTTVSSGTVSLLTCQSNRFIDNSGTASTLTISGTPSVQAFSPFAPTAAYDTSVVGGSGYFDGSGDYLSAAANAAFAPGTGDFAIQCWVYFTSISGTILPICQNDAIGTSSSDKFWVGIQSNTLRLSQHNTANAATCPLTPVANQWYNIAISRLSGTVYMWINGVSQTVTNSTVFSSTSFSQNGFVIGAMSTPYYLTGYITSFQYQVGTGFSSYTLPTAPINTAGTNAKLLLNYTNAGIYDAAAKNDLETVGNAQVSTTQAKFGTTSISFNGSGNGLQFPSNQLLNVGTGDFTIECWAYVSDLSTYRGVFQISGTAGGYSTTITNSLGMDFKSGGTGFEIYAKGASNQVTYSVSTNTWYYLAIVRSGTTTTFYVNGTSQATYTADSTNYNGTYLGIGNIYSGAYPFSGYMDEFRITRYARTISASPTAAFPVQ